MTIVRLPWGKRPQPRTVFVLGGGGNLGAIQVGMLEAVLERGIVPDAIVGCSAGAINAAAIAADPTPVGAAKLRRIWTAVHEQGVIRPSTKLDTVRLLLRRGASIQDSDALRELLTSSIPHQRFEDYAVPFEVVATSLSSGEERWFSEGPVLEPLLASAALPAVFPPVEVGGELFIDGGIVNNVPISRAYQLRPTRVVVFHVGNFERERPAPSRPVDVLVHAFSIARAHRFHTDTHMAAPEGVDLLVLPGVDPGPVGYTDFSRSGELVELGYHRTAAFLDARVPVAVAR